MNARARKASPALKPSAAQSKADAGYGKPRDRQARARRVEWLDIGGEIRRLNRTQALVLAIYHASNEGADFDVADALFVVSSLLRESVSALDRLDSILSPE